ncbi:hypothetical protein [Nitrosophilus alvini]|uniref:hypothetical protein n=1 Tax=Nitrosophilus alvini TaxID=2714855 RepID=UPI001909C25D|nr:hypothetical protein [Nitrosophilus alvini]
MRKRAVAVILLFAMFLNISHALVFTAADHCEHISVEQYIAEIEQSEGCGDVCDFHHMFHFNAIPATSHNVLLTITHCKKVPYNPTEYKSPYLKQVCEPPKA